MRKRTRLLISTSVLVIVIGAIFFVGKPEPAAAQVDGFEIYQLILHCGRSGLPSAMFGHQVTDGGTVGRPLQGTWTICAGNFCPGGAVSFADALAGLPAGVSAALKAKVEKHPSAGEGWFRTCVGDEKNPPEKKCEKPIPWFDGSSGCAEVQSPVVAINYGRVTVTICGYPVFVGTPQPVDTDLLLASLERDKITYFVQGRLGSRVCCTRLKEAARTGKPCYPAVDIDCDGKPNQSDVIKTDPITYPDINGPFTKAKGASIDPFPSGLDPDDNDFLPPQDKCDCKWELKKGTLNCSRDGKQQHFYQAWWRCPSTGNERFTRKYAPATAECESPKRASLIELYTGSVTLFEFAS